MCFWKNVFTYDFELYNTLQINHNFFLSLNLIWFENIRTYGYQSFSQFRHKKSLTNLLFWTNIIIFLKRCELVERDLQLGTVHGYFYLNRISLYRRILLFASLPPFCSSAQNSILTTWVVSRDCKWTIRVYFTWLRHNSTLIIELGLVQNNLLELEIQWTLFYRNSMKSFAFHVYV